MIVHEEVCREAIGNKGENMPLFKRSTCRFIFDQDHASYIRDNRHSNTQDCDYYFKPKSSKMQLIAGI